MNDGHLEDGFTPSILGKQCINSELSWSLYTDVMTAEGLDVQRQQFAYILQNDTDNNATTPAVAHDGVIGLPWWTEDPATFVQNLCNQGNLTQCRFGLALNTAGAGSLILGGIKENELEHNRTATNFSPDDFFIDGGEVVYSVAGKPHSFQNQSLYPVSEVTNVLGPIHQVRNILGGMNATLFESGDRCATLLFGTYPCNATPPEFGFSFKSESPDVNSGLVLPFDTSAWTLAEEGGTCTAPIVGWDGVGNNNTWYLGQAWLRGKYVDFDLDNHSITFAKLKENNDGTVGAD